MITCVQEAAIFRPDKQGTEDAAQTSEATEPSVGSPLKENSGVFQSSPS